MTRLLILLSLTTLLPACGDPPPARARWQQPSFAIAMWGDPLLTDAAYARAAKARFTLVFGGVVARTPEQAKTQLALAGKHGLNVMLYPGKADAAALPRARHCWGTLLADEPSAANFASLAARQKALRAARAGELPLINLFPNYAEPRQLGTDDYREYLRRYVETVDPDVLCVDHYPLMRPEKDERERCLDNLVAVRAHALKRGVPFWWFIHTMPINIQFDPTEAQLRWMVNSALAHGARGIGYFCYRAPRGHREFARGGGIITADGRVTRHHAEVTRINARLQALGPTLMKLTSTKVVRTTHEMGEGARARALADTGLAALDAEGCQFVVGAFRHADGRRAVLIVNHRHAYAAWPTLRFAGEAVEVDPASGKEIPVRDDSPDMEGLQLSFDAGHARLFLLPKAR